MAVNVSVCVCVVSEKGNIIIFSFWVKLTIYTYFMYEFSYLYKVILCTKKMCVEKES